MNMLVNLYFWQTKKFDLYRAVCEGRYVSLSVVKSVAWLGQVKTEDSRETVRKSV